MPWALVAIAALQIGASFMQQKQSMKAAQRAGERSAAQGTENQNKLVRETQRQRRAAQGVTGGTALGGPTTSADQVSQTGTVLTQQSATQKRSILGG